MAEMAEIYQWDLWEVIIFTTEETEKETEIRK
jgi:hypothetical protein